MTPYWEKLKGRPDVDVTVSADGTHVDVAYLKPVPLAALRKILACETVEFGKGPKR